MSTGNWLKDWILTKTGKKGKGGKDKVQDADGPNVLFAEINKLRSPMENDADAIEKAKYTEGVLGKIATSKAFEFSTLGMICFNALAIGYDANYTAQWGKPDNLLEGPLQFIIVENMFCSYFTTEVVIRFLAYKKKCNCLCDAWFMFDSILVTMMVAETWVMPFLGSGGPLAQLSIFRLLRLLRITRISRIMRAVPEMMVIIRGMVAATRTVACTGALMILVLYVFSIIFTDAYHERPIPPEDEETQESEAFFGTMGKSMFSLFIMGTILDDYTAATTVIRHSNKVMMIPFVIFTLISSFMMLNMLVGILVEVVQATAEGERQKSVETKVREAIAAIFSSMDKNNNNEISRGEFLLMRQDKDVMEALAELDIQNAHFNLYAELFFRPEDDGAQPNLSYDKLVSMIFRLRPGGFVSALDFAAFSKVIDAIHERVKNRIGDLDYLCQAMWKEESDEQPGVGAPRLLPPPDPATGGASCDAPHLSSLNASCREHLRRIESTELVEELQRRLGAEHLDSIPSMGEELQNSSLPAVPQTDAEAFLPPGVPVDDDDSAIVYV